MRISFLSPDNCELVVLPEDYPETSFDLKEAIFDFFLFKEETWTDITLIKKYKDWKIFRSVKVGSFCNIIYSTHTEKETIGTYFNY